MSGSERAFLILWLAGILALVGGLFVTRLNWRRDIAPFGRHSKIGDIALHPDKYATPDALTLIKALTRFGWICLSSGLALLGYEGFHVMRAR